MMWSRPSPTTPRLQRPQRLRRSSRPSNLVFLRSSFLLMLRRSTFKLVSSALPDASTAYLSFALSGTKLVDEFVHYWAKILILILYSSAEIFVL